MSLEKRQDRKQSGPEPGKEKKSKRLPLPEPFEKRQPFVFRESQTPYEVKGKPGPEGGTAPQGPVPEEENAARGAAWQEENAAVRMVREPEGTAKGATWQEKNAAGAVVPEPGENTSTVRTKPLQPPDSQPEQERSIPAGAGNGTDPGSMPDSGGEDSSAGIRRVYLTFDDGPSKENTYKVLEVLNKRGIKATFFLIGIYVKWYPDIARQIVRDGHAIGIHCYIHDYDVIYRSVDDYIDDFEKAHQIIKEVLGIEPKIFRFPGGSDKEICKDIAAEMEKRGYIFYDWNAGLEDAVIEPKPEELIDNAVESAHRNGKDKEIIMLAHDRVYATGECLDELLDRLPGYQMKLLTEAVEPVQFVKRL